MKKKYLHPVLILLCFFSNFVFAQGSKYTNSAKKEKPTKHIAKENTEKKIGSKFTPNGTLNSYVQYYGKAGEYKTQGVQIFPINLNYNFTEKFSMTAQWYRFMNAYNYNPNDPKANNNDYSHIYLQANYAHGNLGNSKVSWTDTLVFRTDNYFSETGDKGWVWYKPTIDFSGYFPSHGNFKVTQFALSPGVMYGYDMHGSNDNVKSAFIGLFTSYQLPAGFSIQLNIFGWKDWYKGNMFEVAGPNNRSYKSNWYWAVLAYINYTNEIYRSKDNNLSFTFNIQGGLDPFIGASKTSFFWLPMWTVNYTNEFIGPTSQTNEAYRNTYSLYVLPQFMLNYNITKKAQLYTFIQVKFSNQVYGAVEKDYKFMPQAGLGINYSF